MSFNPFSGARRSLLCFQVVLFQQEQLNFILKLCRVMCFYALQVSFEKIYYTLTQEPDKLFWARLLEKILAFVGK